MLGFVLDPERSGSLPQVPIITRNAPRLDELWAASGAAAPLSLLTERAGGLGALSLPASGDGVVRYAPLLVGVGGQVLPGLAIESIRVARGGSAYLLQADPLVLATADVQIPLSPDALLRLVPRSQSASTARTVSALDVLEGRASAGRLTGAIVLLGGSAPELGGLRETVGDPLTPSVQIQANAVEQIRDGRFPRPIGHTRLMQTLLVLVLGALALAASLSLSPVLGTIGLATIILVSWAGAVASSMLVDRLIDPLTPSLAGAAVFAIASITSFAVTQRREALVRQRFEQHLAPAVVRRIVEHPTLVKLTGERREVTSLFTDVEGFTALTHRADAEALVDVLDHYFEGIAALIVEHGGMVDKIVGDAVHALFNAPLDLDGSSAPGGRVRGRAASLDRVVPEAPGPRSHTVRAHTHRYRNRRGHRRRCRLAFQARLHGLRRCRECCRSPGGSQQGARLVDLYRAGRRGALRPNPAAAARHNRSAWPR